MSRGIDPYRYSSGFSARFSFHISILPQELFAYKYALSTGYTRNPLLIVCIHVGVYIYYIQASSDSLLH